MHLMAALCGKLVLVMPRALMAPSKPNSHLAKRDGT